MCLKFYILCVCIVQIIAERCTTPNHEEAECVSLYTCPVLLNALTTQKSTVLEFVSKSHCGNSSEPMVCCGTMSEIQIGNRLSDVQYCGLQHTDDYIYTGKGTALDEFPWLSVLIYKNVTSGVQTVTACSGSLFNTRYVLTAAQCLSIPQLVLVSVRLGDHNIKTENDCVEHPQFKECNTMEEFGVEEKIPHADYSRKSAINDIALIRLNRTVYYTDYIRPICLPISTIQSAKPDDTLVTSGWGERKENTKPAEIKKRIFTTLITNEECRETYKNSRRSITENQMCTRDFSNNTEFSCAGDAGAPVMVQNRKFQWHQEGISSWGNVCGDMHPQVNTKVVSYLKWIQDNMKKPW